MNAPHLHLILVHIPVVLVPTGLALILIAMWRGSDVLRGVALSLFVVASLVVVPTFLSGEQAEEAIEELPGISERIIEDHEESADVALWATVGLGVLSALVLVGANVPWLSGATRLHPIVLLLGVASSVALALAANAGGRIRHPEAFEDVRTPVGIEAGRERGED